MRIIIKFFIIFFASGVVYTLGRLWGVEAGPRACAPPPSRAQTTPSAWVGIGARMHLFGDGANSETVEAVDDIQVRAVRTENEGEGAGRVRRKLRGQPVVAVRAVDVEAATPAEARRRQEYCAAVDLASEFAPFDTVHRRPFIGAVFNQFFLLLF